MRGDDGTSSPGAAHADTPQKSGARSALQISFKTAGPFRLQCRRAVTIEFAVSTRIFSWSRSAERLSSLIWIWYIRPFCCHHKFAGAQEPPHETGLNIPPSCATGPSHWRSPSSRGSKIRSCCDKSAASCAFVKSSAEIRLALGGSRCTASCERSPQPVPIVPCRIVARRSDSDLAMSLSPYAGH